MRSVRTLLALVRPPTRLLAASAGAFVAALLLAAPAGAGDRQAYPSRGRLGLEVQGMTAELREFFRAPAENGVLVVRVVDGMPAARADLRVGDVILSAGSEPIGRPHDLVAIVAHTPAGQAIPLDVVRDGQIVQIEVTPEGEPMSREALEEWHRRVWRKSGRKATDRAELSDRLAAIERRLASIERALGVPATATADAPADPAPAPAPAPAPTLAPTPAAAVDAP